MSAAVPALRRSRLGRRIALWGAGAPFLLLVAVVFVTAATTTNLCGPSGSPSSAAAPSEEALSDIPGNYLQLYVAAGEKYGLDWSILAGIGSIESNHGRLKAPGVTSGVNEFGCCGGPMQFYFMPFGGKLRDGERNTSTWGGMSVDGNGDGFKVVWDPADAIPSAARYLKASGAPGNWQRAIFAYNRAQWYVDDVLSRAKRYRGAAAGAGGLQAMNVSAPSPSGVSAQAGRPVNGGSSRMVMPAKGPRSSGFGPRSSPGGIGSTNHQGLDIAAPAGSPIVAALGGKIVTRAATGGYGNLVCLEHRQDLFTCYGHMSSFGPQRVGQAVEQGETIGKVGSTGNSTGPHLHFEVRKSADGGQVDPAPYLDGAQTVDATHPGTNGTGEGEGEGAQCPAPDLTPVSATGSGRWSGAEGKYGVSGAASIDPLLVKVLDATARHTSYEPKITVGSVGHSATTTSGKPSEHASGRAADFWYTDNDFPISRPGAGSRNKGDELAAAAMIALGIPPKRALSAAHRGGAHQLTGDVAGRRVRVQVIWRSQTGGDHNDHVHIGALDLGKATGAAPELVSGP